MCLAFLCSVPQGSSPPRPQLLQPAHLCPLPWRVRDLKSQEVCIGHPGLQPPVGRKEAAPGYVWPPAAPGLARSLIPSALSAGQPLPERLPVLWTHPESPVNIPECSRKQRKLESAGHREISPPQAGGTPLLTLMAFPRREKRHAPIVQVGTLRHGRATAGLTAYLRQPATDLPAAHLRKGFGYETQGASATVLGPSPEYSLHSVGGA